MTAKLVALAGEGGAGSAGEDGSVEVAAEGDGGDDVVFVAGNDDADGDVAVVGGVGRVESAGGGIEADFAADFFAQTGGELIGVGEGVVRASVRAREHDEWRRGHSCTIRVVGQVFEEAWRWGCGVWCACGALLEECGYTRAHCSLTFFDSLIFVGDFRS